MKRHALLAACLSLAACASVSPASASRHPEAASYDASADAMAEVDAALARAEGNGKRVIVALGANWCHDSRAFAGWLDTPRFQAMADRAFEIVFVDVGNPQAGEGRNLAVARRFGIDPVEGTPTVLVLDADGTLLNPETARGWRNAASRSEDAIYAELERFAPPSGA